MRRIIAYIVLLSLSGIYIAASIPELSRCIYNLHVLPDLHQFGDLYNVSYLARYRRFNPPCNYQAPLPKSNRKVRLIIIGDSFTEKLKASDFSVDSLQFVHWDNQLVTSLDTGWTNILLLEAVERFASRLYQLADNVQIRSGPKKRIENYQDTKWQKVTSRIFGNGMDQNLEFLVFNNAICNKIKEFKATMHERIFDRLSKVIESKQREMLYYTATVDTLDSNSSFYNLSDVQIKDYVNGINNSVANYKNAGFDKVFFSIIPNKVSIVEPGEKYNHKIERIQADTALYANFINAYGILKPIGEQGYYYNDTHWSCEGRNAWLNEVNKLIDSLRSK